MRTLILQEEVMRRLAKGAPTSERRAFGEWLAGLRDAAGLTQDEAADRAGISRIHWHRLERGVSGTSREKIPAISAAVHASEAETYRRAGFAPPAPVPATESAELFGAEIRRLIERVPPDKRSLVQERLRREAESLVALTS